MNEAAEVPAGVDPATPAPARIYDYLLSGDNNFQSDRDAGTRVDRPDHVVSVASGRQAGTDVDELPDPAARDPPGRPLMEATVGPRTVPDLRYQRHDALGRVAVGPEVVIPA